MSGLLEIRPAHLGDAAGITAIYGHYVAHTVLTVDLKAPSVEEWQVRLASLAESGHHVLVAVEAGQVLGYALVTPWIAKPAFRHTAENSIYLAPGATGASRGRRLLERLLEDARSAGIRQLLALIAASDTDGRPSLALHRAAGFEPIGRLRRVGWKHGRWVDVDVLQRDLTT